MIIYKTVQKAISQDSQQKMQFLEYTDHLNGVQCTIFGICFDIINQFCTAPSGHIFSCYVLQYCDFFGLLYNYTLGPQIH